MSQRVIIFLILVGGYMGSSCDITIFCDYRNDHFHRTLYTCAATASEPEDPNDICDIRAVKGQHKYGLEHKDVEAFFMENEQLFHFPRNLSSFFPNLKSLSYKNNFITEVAKSDLESFPKLETLILSNNSISRIDEDIFEGLPLRSIEIADNNIEFVLHSLTLPKSLEYLNFLKNKCIDMEGKSTDGIDRLKDKLLLRCSHSPRILIIEDVVKIIINNNLKSEERIKALEKINKKLKDALMFKFW